MCVVLAEAVQRISGRYLRAYHATKRLSIVVHITSKKSRFDVFIEDYLGL